MGRQFSNGVWNKAQYSESIPVQRDETTIKRFTEEGGKALLLPDNRQFPVPGYHSDSKCLGFVLERQTCY